MAGDEVGLRRQTNGDVAGVLAPTPLDVLDVEVVLPFSHAQLRVALIARQPVHEQVIGEAQLGQAGLDGVFDVALHGAGGMSTARGVDVVVDQWQRHDPSRVRVSP